MNFFAKSMKIITISLEKINLILIKSPIFVHL